MRIYIPHVPAVIPGTLVLNSLWLKMKIFLQQPIYQIKTTTFALEGFQENVLFVIHRQL